MVYSMNIDKLKKIFMVASAVILLAATASAQNYNSSGNGNSSEEASAEKARDNSNPGTDRLFAWRTFIWESRNPDRELWPANGERGRVSFELQRMFINNRDWQRFVGSEAPQFWTLRFSIQPVHMFHIDATVPDRYELGRKVRNRVKMSMALDYHYVMLRFRPDLMPFIKPYAGIGWSFWKGRVELYDEFNHTTDRANTVGSRYCLGADFLIDSNHRSLSKAAPSLYIEWIYDKATLDYVNFGDFDVSNHGWAGGIGVVIY
jgi:opacity protein-like surface antigen